MILAKNIRYLRKKRNLSQDELAKKLGYKSFTTIQKWETGVADPPLKTVKQLADIFSVDIDDLTVVDLSTSASREDYKRIVEYYKAVYDKLLKLDGVDKAKIEERIDVMLEDDKYKG